MRFRAVPRLSEADEAWAGKSAKSWVRPPVLLSLNTFNTMAHTTDQINKNLNVFNQPLLSPSPDFTLHAPGNPAAQVDNPSSFYLP